MMQPASNAINRVLKAWGLGSTEDPQCVHRLAYLVVDHKHFSELLKACDPNLRRDMYDAMSPHLRFEALPLESYIIMAKEYAAAAELPVMDENGLLHPYRSPNIQVDLVVNEIQLWVLCDRCKSEAIFCGERDLDAIRLMRNAGWAYDETAARKHLCPDCLDEVGSDAIHTETGTTAVEQSVPTE